MASRAGKSTAAVEVQSDYDKLRRTPYLYAFNVLNMAALLCTVNSPLALYAAELGVEKGRIGFLIGILPFAQVLCIAFLPLVMAYSQRFITGAAYGARYIFILPLLAAPLLGDPDMVFWLLFGCMTAFAIARTLAETAIYPWSQEYMPKQARGRINGITSLVLLPVALGGSVIIQLWLDSRVGIERFFPVFVIGVVFGLTSVLSLIGLRGGKPRPDTPRGFAAIKAMRTPLRDRNFWIYLYSSGTQYFVYTAINLFLVLFFRDRLGMSSGQLVLLVSLVPVGGALGAVVAGWFVDRYGTRAIRVTLQSWQVVLLLSLLLIQPGIPFPELVAGVCFFLVGLPQASIGVGNIYMLNYVPPKHKENYMTMAYASDGIIGGGATFLVGFLLQWLDASQVTLMGTVVDSYDVLFVLCAIVLVTSALAFAALKEEGATGVRAFFRNFGQGSAIRALISIPRYGALTSEERRQEITYGFGGTRSALVKEELIAALSDPSFDVRHEAIQSLGRLPPNRAVIEALEGILGYDGLAELQYAALTSLGRLRARQASPRVAAFLDNPNILLRARAIRSLGDIGDETYLPRIRQVLNEDSEINCRLAAASALGKYRDRESVAGLVALYVQLAQDDGDAADEPRSKVVLLALAKILGLEESFSREWRFEERMLGSRLPRLVERLAWTVRRMPGKQSGALAQRIKATALPLSTGETDQGFLELQGLSPRVEASVAPDAPLVMLILNGTRGVARPHRALLILLALAERKCLLARAR